MFVLIWIIGWAVFAISAAVAVVYKVETETSSRHTIVLKELTNSTNTNIYSRWSEWTEWSSCSRSCGGGIKLQTRTCIGSDHAKSEEFPKHYSKKNILKKHKCSGMSKRFKLCNDHKCSLLVKDFRAIQCKNFDNRAFAGVHYTWEPFYDDKNQCALNCRPLGHKFYATLNNSVIDGTPCKLQPHERSVCVDGRCKFVGCDGIIGGSINDVCGVCGGKNSTCRLVSGLFTKPFLAAGYNYITDIPLNACNLKISQMKETTNLIALRFKNGTFILNGDFSPSPPGVIRAAGTIFTFSKGGTSTVGDFIFSPGPITRTLELLLLYRQVNAGIEYEYRILMPQLSRDSALRKGFTMHNNGRSSVFDFMKFNDTEQKNHSTSSDIHTDNSDVRDIINDEEFKPKINAKKRKNKYIWKITSYTPCSRTCGEGTKIGMYSCVKEHDQDYVVPDKKCANKKPESEWLSCYLQKCPSAWVVGEWNACSVTCGEGIEKRDLTCVQEVSSLEKVQVSEDECASKLPQNILRSRPCFRKPCNNGSDTAMKPFWKTGTWSMCSARCGTGVKTRTVKCMAENDDDCVALERPASETTCDMGPCQFDSSMQWLTTEWSEKCSENCGTGIQSRRVACSSDTREQPTCSEHNKPPAFRNCSNNERCGGRWFLSPWSQCSADCGWGKQMRSVVCLAYSLTNNTYSFTNDNNCDEKEKPILEQTCFIKDCEPDWFWSSWSQCSRSCDSGLQVRKVLCIRDDHVLSGECKDENKPSSKQFCNSQKCTYALETTNHFLETLLHSNSTCADEYPNCNLVVQARLCGYKYYQQYCCKSCHGLKYHHVLKPDGSSISSKVT